MFMKIEDAILDFLNYCIFEKGLSDRTKESYYNDLEVYYDLDVVIDPGEEIEITYRVTTAEGVETPLKVITTPTLTEYR